MVFKPCRAVNHMVNRFSFQTISVRFLELLKFNPFGIGDVSSVFAAACRTSCNSRLTAEMKIKGR
jgi:hypothetical protein